MKCQVAEGNHAAESQEDYPKPPESTLQRHISRI